MRPSTEAARIQRELRLGIIGLSEGNGHPYSWSAIINGYEPETMATCPFPVIPAYLSEQRFPEAQLTGARVTHVWTQDATRSRHIAAASRIAHVVDRPQEMLGSIDALLLARDDAENHRELATPFLEAGIPVYIDKPIALSVDALDSLFGMALFEHQIFSCSALRYSPDLIPTAKELSEIGTLRHVVGISPNTWRRYAMHLVDPVLAVLAPGTLERTSTLRNGAEVSVSAVWDTGLSATLTTTGERTGAIALTFIGTLGTLHKDFANSFVAFRSALALFIQGVRDGTTATSYRQLRDAVEIVEVGMQATNGDLP